MNEFLVKHFVKNYQNTHDPKVRIAYGTLGSIFGILCNLVLFACKFVIGSLMHSVAITADGLNNLSDCITCIVSLIGYYVSNKPADESHPFGHGRMEYLFSFIAAFSIFAVAIELLKESVSAFLHPAALDFQIGLVIVLALSILVKIWMAQFYGYLAGKTNNSILYASSKDSQSDVLTTSLTVLSLFVGLAYPSFPIGGIVGICMGFLILKAGYELSCDIIDRLIGKPVDAALVRQIEQQITAHEGVIGVHDIVIHDYGAEVQIGSGHVELRSTISFVKAHEIVDACEQEIKELLGVTMTLHMDPVDLEDPLRNRYDACVRDIVSKIDSSFSIHDFRLIHQEGDVVLAFDLLVPYDCPLSRQELETRIAKDLPGDVHLSIVLDHNLIGKEG